MTESGRATSEGLTVELLASVALLWLFIAGVQRLATGELGLGNPADRLAGLFGRASGPTWPVGIQEETDVPAWAQAWGGSPIDSPDGARAEIAERHSMRGHPGRMAGAGAHHDAELVEVGVCPVPVAPLETFRVGPRRTMTRSA
ncbi:MAG: hypothetical protein ACP5VP_07320 [Candidatus Limnocylindrales bacterium]